MTDIVFDIRSTFLQRAFAALRRRDLSTGPVMRAIARRLRNSAEDAFQAQRSPFGQRWPALSRATIEARIARITRGGKGLTKSGRLSSGVAARASGMKMLQDSGQLAASITATSDDTSATLAASKVYARIQHFGGNAGRGRSVSIPGRAYMPIDEDGNLPEPLRQSIMTMLQDHYAGR
ncbi:phage virion morphogenesis protein [Methyloversatilis discipulorum]|uniref:phage virion morphogenesis protein n=1 Tax=Methyloversatilis discipulorum TaxID=1119528 RepID=UPI001A3933E9|nr:phage virion morphogenesis protein [Methyloversatilis discipulorum]MBL8467367.1 phage virion morphogenesis protein [Methyloversatilis discipulorum]